MRIKHTVLLRMARDTDMRRQLFYDDSQLAEVIIDDYEHEAQGHVAIAASSTGTLSFGDITEVRGLYLELDQDATVRLNGSLDDIVLAIPPGGSVAKFFIEATITAVEIENTGTEELSGLYVFWGDEAA
jgi:hypothetical protein